LTVSDIGGWDLNLHHRYNPQEGILYRGDGSNVFLRERPRLIFDVMGDGKRRNVDCDNDDCYNGNVEEQRLLSPVALAAASDGSVFVGDYNLIRRIRPDRVITTVLKLKSSGMAYRYHLSVSPHDDVLYVSDPESHRVIRVKNSDEPADIENNFEVVVGSGIRCLPGDGDSCGDGGPAKDARLFYPKGVAIAADRKLYLADGTTIRVVDEEGVIDTLIGSKFPEKLWKPMSCAGTTRLEDAALRWPTEMAVNPLDNSLYFVDDGVVAKVTSDGRLQMIAGRPLHCRPPASAASPAASSAASFFNFASQSTLVSPTSIAFSLQGDLYLAESDSRRINRISVVGTDGRIRSFAGKDSKCNCQDADCVCYEKDVLIATETIFGSISSVAASPDGRLYIADLAGRRVRMVESNSTRCSLPRPKKSTSSTGSGCTRRPRTSRPERPFLSSPTPSARATASSSASRTRPGASSRSAATTPDR
jgi:sugar lactone lactonase YvrE